ncbi:hypothetical protein D3C84_792630 [compost metagenome]
MAFVIEKPQEVFVDTPLAFTQQIGSGEPEPQILGVGVKTVPIAGLDFGGIIVRDFVVANIKSSVCVAVFEEEIESVFFGAPINGNKLFWF